MKTLSKLHENHFNVMVESATDPENFPAASEHEKVSVQYSNEQNKELKEELRNSEKKLMDDELYSVTLLAELSVSKDMLELITKQRADLVIQLAASKCRIMELEEGLCSCRDGLIWRKENYPNGFDKSDADQLEYVNQLINP